MIRPRHWKTFVAAVLAFALGIEVARLFELTWERPLLRRGESAVHVGLPPSLARRVGQLEQQNQQLTQQLEALVRATADSTKGLPGQSVYLRPVHAYPIPDEVRFCGEALPLRDADARARFTGELYRLLSNRHWVVAWIERSRAVFPIVEQRLRAAQMPDDLKYVMVIESALDPRAVSTAEAVGYWQFIEPTGNRYGLRRDLMVDDRRDLGRATDAAIEYLRDLHGELGSWPLALSGYNAGEQRVRNAIADQGTRDFYSMVLPRETESYWFRAAAVKLLFENPAAYDFPAALPVDGLTPCDTLLVKVAERLPLRQVAAASGISYRHLHQLNPRFLRTWLPAGEHRLAVPRPSVEGVLAAFPQAQLLARGSQPAATQRLATGAQPAASSPAPGAGDADATTPGGGSPR